MVQGLRDDLQIQFISERKSKRIHLLEKEAEELKMADSFKRLGLYHAHPQITIYGTVGWAEPGCT